MGCVDHPAAATIRVDPPLEILICDFCDVSTEPVAGAPMRGCDNCGRAMRVKTTIVGRCGAPGCTNVVTR
jgi:hypothetical protein